MALVNNCPKCATRLSVDDSLAGRKVRCPKCQEVFTMTAPVAAVLPVAIPQAAKPPHASPIRPSPPPAAPQAAPARATPPPLPPASSSEIQPELSAFDFQDDPAKAAGKKAKEAPKKPPVAAQIIGAIGAIAGAILGRVVGIPVLIVVVFAAIVGTPLYFLTTGARRRMVFAGALQAGHALWMLLGAVLIAAGAAPGVQLDPLLVVEGVLYFAGAIVVVLLPYLPVIIVMTVYQTAALTINVMTVGQPGLPPVVRNALFLHMFLRVLAVAMMFLAYFEKPKDKEPSRGESPPHDDFEESPRQRRHIAKEIPLKNSSDK